MREILSKQFYLQDDVTHVARSLLGMVLVRSIGQERISGKIIETEAYKGFSDKASHSYLGKKTKRNDAMYEEGATAYVYVCYGIYPLLNVVTNKKEIPDAVLIRALEPLEGIEKMQTFRKKNNPQDLCSGPAKLTQALCVTQSFNHTSLINGDLSIEDHGFRYSESEIIESKRIGVEFAKEDANLKWRFCIKNHPLISKR